MRPEPVYSRAMTTLPEVPASQPKSRLKSIGRRVRNIPRPKRKFEMPNSESGLKIVIATDAWKPQLNGVVTTLDTLGLEYLPSSTNFVYFKSGKEANDVQKAFAEKKISVRGQYMDYNEWTRVSMGKIEDVERFCKALPQVLGA